MLRIPHCLDNRLTVNCEILRERERENGEVVVVRDTTLVGGRDGNIIFCYWLLVAVLTAISYLTGSTLRLHEVKLSP
jgi:hypothetical protein